MKKIKITDLLSSACMNDFVMEEVKECHPLQIMSSTIPVPIWKIVYKYKTQRGNDKQATKYLILHETAWDLVDNEFQTYICRFNEKHPDRKLSNVEILDSSYLGELEIELE